MNLPATDQPGSPPANITDTYQAAGLIARIAISPAGLPLLRFESTSPEQSSSMSAARHDIGEQLFFYLTGYNLVSTRYSL
ncbi:MAG: hypothetical protein IBX69_14865 [Anaerolineales bacterium]|nr:hypothetical protein [Anaerolineales bacterium]